MTALILFLFATQASVVLVMFTSIGPLQEPPFPTSAALRPGRAEVVDRTLPPAFQSGGPAPADVGELQRELERTREQLAVAHARLGLREEQQPSDAPPALLPPTVAAPRQELPPPPPLARQSHAGQGSSVGDWPVRPSLPTFDTLPVQIIPDTPNKYPVPGGVREEHLWRYSSAGLDWLKHDSLYRKFMHYSNNLNMELPPMIVWDEVEHVCNVLKRKGRDKLCDMFRNCFPNTLKTTTELLPDGTTYIITGDIPLMWMRDSAAQVNQYIELATESPELQVIIEGTIRRQIKWIGLDPYGSSFRLFLDFDHKGKRKLTDWDFESGRTIHVAMHNYEIDSLCYFLRLSHRYWTTTGVEEIFEEEWLGAAKLIVQTWQLEQDHSRSSYTYPELRHGQGAPVCHTGMTWGGFRPSDDPCTYHYLVPSNMFAVVTLGYLEEILDKFYPAERTFRQEVTTLRLEIDAGIHEYAVVEDEIGPVYAYEVDGCGNANMMDDANVPSLLSIDYLGYTSPHDPDGRIAANTRQFILSKKNPFFFQGSAASGIGSPHTQPNSIWPMSLIMQALSSDDLDEINELINTLEATDAGTNFMHESFNKNNPDRFSRTWFAWANSLFSELIIKHLEDIR